jgi:nucleotide-binding universal stress UspA family protein
MEEAMFRYILVPATGSEADTPVFGTALAVAHPSNGHLAFLHVRLNVERLLVPTVAAEFGGGSGIAELAEALEREVIARQDRAKAAVESFCKSSQIVISPGPVDRSITAQWREVLGNEANQLAKAGRAADLLVMGRAWGESSADVLNSVLMEAGRPLLIAPPRPPASIGQSIAIAWKNSAEAASAVAAALPLLQNAKQVTILSVAEQAKADKDGCEGLREALAWHNPSTKVMHLVRGSAEVADKLLSVAADVGADLLVIGDTVIAERAR